MHRFRHPLSLTPILALVAALALAACGGSGGDEDPREVLRETFSNSESIRSGVFDLELSVNAEGDNAGSFDVDLAGPFQGGEGGVPAFEVEADVSADTPQGDISFAGGLTSTGEDAFVRYQDIDYAVPQQLFRQFADTFSRLQREGDEERGESGNLLKRIGIDPTDWLTDLENHGDEDVEGANTVHVSGSADVEKLLEDVQRLAEQAGPNVQQLTPEQLEEAADSIQTAELDVYSGADDRLLRRLSATLELKPAEGEGAPDLARIEFTLTLSEVNDPQEIEAPAESEPLEDLLGRLGVDPSQLGAGLGAQGGQSGVGEGGAPEAPSSDAAQAYLECLQNAEGAEALQDCAELIQ